ncbi:receptor-type tyrosine-protein phosphatase S-like [Ptychodera flava]|uniref:receptor-type tyrosine-protein phosphatase S-like n=1 Tax=Ptychodera flava TaxID=63121 RepID=UPI00396A1DB7
MNSGQPTSFRCRVTANEADTTVTLTTSSRSHHGDVTSGNHPDYEFSNTFNSVVVAKCDTVECKVMPGNDRTQIIADAYIQPVLTRDPWITDIAKTEMKVNWYAWDTSVDIGDGPIENYEVWYKVANDNEFERYVVTAAHQTYSLITGLTPYMSYTFAVRTYRPGDGGGGDLGPAVTEQTLCDVPLGIPTMKTPMAISKNEILVTWEIDEAYLEPEILRCDSVTSYTIHYRVNGTSIEYETRATGPDQTSLLLDELDPCTEYEISVTMDNSIGHGKLSDPLFNTTLSSPTPISCPVFNGVTILLSCISLILFIVLILIFLGFIYFKRTGKMWNCLLPNDIDKESVPMQPINSKQGKTITEDDTHRNHTYADPDDVIIKQCKTQDQENNYATFHHDESEYESLADATRQTKTTIAATDIKEAFANLLKTDQETNESYLHLEWQELNKTKFTPKRSDCSSGRRPNNANKNRYMNLLPLDKNRVKLVTVVQDTQSTDYINASYVDAFSVKSGFLVTQLPLPHTVIDFWRMVYDNKSNTIVMLNDTDKDNPTNGQYWPVENVSEFGPFKIELLQTREIGCVVNRVLKLSMGDQNPSTIQQFQLLEWPPGISTSQFTSAFLELMMMVKRWQEQSGQRPTVVHCLNGVGRSGVFCASVSACERIKAEQWWTFSNQ